MLLLPFLTLFPLFTNALSPQRTIYTQTAHLSPAPTSASEFVCSDNCIRELDHCVKVCLEDVFSV
jgi:hypothetical protein